MFHHEIHGKIPARGDVIEFGEYKFFIESVINHRIRRVKFVIPMGEGELSAS